MEGPYKFTDQKRARFLGALRAGLRRGQAAKAAGVTRHCVAWWCRTHPDFLTQIEQAELDACEPIEDALYRQALQGHFQSIIFWLMNRSPDRWRDRRQPVQAVTVAAAPEAPDELRRRLEELLAPPPTEVTITTEGPTCEPPTA